MTLDRNVESVFPLSPTQEGMLYHTLQSHNESVYIGQHVIALSDIDPIVLKHAWSLVVKKYSALRSLFVWEGISRSVQVVLTDVEPEWKYKAFMDSNNELEQWLLTDRTASFDVSDSPPTRAALLKCADAQYKFVWTRHHLLVDGWSAYLVLRELKYIYTCLIRGQLYDAKEEIGFSDYIGWLQQQDLSVCEKYWQQRLNNVEINPGLELVRDYTGTTSGSRRLQKKLDPKSSEQIKQFAQSNQLTVSTLIHGAWAATLFSCNDVNELIFGSTVSGRPADLYQNESIVGNLINTIPIVVKEQENISLLQWLQNLQLQILQGSTQGHLSNRQLLKALAIPTGTTLFDSIVAVTNYPKIKDKDSALNFVSSAYSEYSHYPVAVLAEIADDLELILIHAPGFLSNAKADLLFDVLINCLKAIPASGKVKPAQFIANNRRLEAGLAFTPLTYEVKNVVSRFLDSVNQYPENIALSDGDTRITYRQLYNAAGNLASHLTTRNIGANDSVIIKFSNKVHAIISVWAVLFSGASYIPVSDDIAPERLQSLLSVSKAKLLLTDLRDSTIGVEQLEVGQIDLEPTGFKPPVIENTSFAYHIYTSGSTGEAKYISVSHSNLAHSLSARLQYYKTPPKRFGLLSPLSFDSSVAGIFWTAAAAGTLVPVPTHLVRDPLNLVAYLTRNQVSEILTLPSVYRAVVEFNDESLAKCIENVIVAGDTCSAELLEMHFNYCPDASFTNEYGPTEATVWATARTYNKPDVTTDDLSIGHAIPGVTLQVLDKKSRPVLPGVVGELHISGPTVTLPSVEFYATGDLVSYDQEGQLFFLGRIDDQLKIRGHRVSLGEIESVLSSHSRIKTCAVVSAPIEAVPSTQTLTDMLNKLPVADALSLLQEVELEHA